MTKTATVVIDTKDKNGVQLESRMRVTTKEGLKAHVTRIDVKSGRAVVIFDEVDGVVPIQPTMRRCNTLAVRKNAGKILFVKEAVKAAKAEKPATAKRAPRKAAAPVETPVEAGAEVTITDEPAVEVETTDELLAGLEVEDLQV